MNTHSHIWPQSIHQAKDLQQELRRKITLHPLSKEPCYAAGVDAAFFDDKIVAVAVVYRFPELTYLTSSYVIDTVHFDYVPGFLSFREGPAMVKALEKLSPEPDIILFDGQGIAHPLNMGIATHLGVLLDIPTIGVAKSRLVGTYQEPGQEKGQSNPLIFHNMTIGAVLRTRKNVKPVFVSPGHKIDSTDSVRIVLQCTTRYRLPEPTRMADILTKKLKKEQS
jgi:deoxyribonuclease V